MIVGVHAYLHIWLVFLAFCSDDVDNMALYTDREKLRLALAEDADDAQVVSTCLVLHLGLIILSCNAYLPSPCTVYSAKESRSYKSPGVGTWSA